MKKDLFEEVKKNHPILESSKEASFKPILDELSRDSYNGASFDRISRQNNEKLNILIKQSAGNQVMHSSLNEQMFGKHSKHNSWNMENKCNLSTLEDYIKRVGDVIKGILAQHPFGINIISLHQHLGDLYGEEFNPKMFGSDNLVSFLLTHFSKIVDIKQAVHGPTGMLAFFVYPKGCIPKQFAPETHYKRYNTAKSRHLPLSTPPHKKLTQVGSMEFHPNTPDMQTSPPKQSQFNNFFQDSKIKDDKARQAYLFKSDIDASFAKDAQKTKRSSFAGGFGGFSAMVAII